MKHLLTALLLTSTLIAMEEIVVDKLPLALSEEAQNSRLFIKNFTEQPLLIKYIDNKKTLERVVRKKSILYLWSPLLLSSVKVFPYGKYRGNVNIESMTGGIAKQPDNAGEILNCIIKETPVDISLNVQPYEGFGSKLLPFSYLVTSKAKEENLDLPTSLKEVFPHVTTLVNELGNLVNALLDRSYKILIKGIRLQEEEGTLHKLATTLFASTNKEKKE